MECLNTNLRCYKGMVFITLTFGKEKHVKIVTKHQ